MVEAVRLTRTHRDALKDKREAKSMEQSGDRASVASFSHTGSERRPSSEVTYQAAPEETASNRTISFPYASGDCRIVGDGRPRKAAPRVFESFFPILMR